MECLYHNGEWTCLSRYDGRVFLGFGEQEGEARVYCMELMRDHNLKKEAERDIHDS